VGVQGQSIIQAYDGEDAWWINPFQTGPDPQSMPEDVAESMVKNEFEDALIDYAEKGHTVELLGTIEVDGIATYEVKLTKENSDVVYYYFDKEYYVPIMQKTEVTSGPMKGQFVETYMSDYQDVKGMMIPHFVEVKIGGSTGQTIKLQNVELNPQVDDLFFSRPKKD
jgi:outer membrane lipoprotein-sorting protein